MMSALIIPAIVFILGLTAGSFLNVVIYRIPRGESIVFPSSHCPQCGQSLRWYHNIPLFSWFFLRGRCAYCSKKISARYPFVELITALLWVVIYLKTGLVWYYPFTAASFSALLALTVIDFEYYAVPDSVNFFALGSALVRPDFVSALTDAAIAAGALWLLARITSIAAKKEAMGSADVIVAGTMAALLGIPGFFAALFISALLAILPSLAARDTMVPFVPFLSLGTLIVYLFDRPVMSLLERIIHG